MGWIIIHKPVRPQSAFGKGEAVYYFGTGPEARFKSFRGLWCHSCAAALEKFHKVLCRIQELWECKIRPSSGHPVTGGCLTDCMQGPGLPSLMGSSPHGCEVKPSTKRSGCRVEVEWAPSESPARRRSGWISWRPPTARSRGAPGTLQAKGKTQTDLKAWKLTCGWLQKEGEGEEEEEGELRVEA